MGFRGWRLADLEEKRTVPLVVHQLWVGETSGATGYAFGTGELDHQNLFDWGSVWGSALLIMTVWGLGLDLSFSAWTYMCHQ